MIGSGLIAGSRTITRTPVSLNQGSIRAEQILPTSVLNLTEATAVRSTGLRLADKGQLRSPRLAPGRTKPLTRAD